MYESGLSVYTSSPNSNEVLAQLHNVDFAAAGSIYISESCLSTYESCLSYMGVYMYVCMYVYMYVCMYICMYVCMYSCMYVCMYIYMYIQMDTYRYTVTLTYTRTHTHTHTHTYTHKHKHTHTHTCTGLKLYGKAEGFYACQIARECVYMFV